MHLTVAVMCVTRHITVMDLMIQLFVMILSLTGLLSGDRLDHAPSAPSKNSFWLRLNYRKLISEINISAVRERLARCTVTKIQENVQISGSR